jgi:uncharacterized protein (TIGR03437 family)
MALLGCGGLSGADPNSFYLRNDQYFFLCPSAPAGLVIAIENMTSSPQTIPSGTVITFAFSVPVTSYGSLVGANTTATISGDVLKVTINAPVTINSAMDLGAGITIAGLANGTPITATVSSEPADALGMPTSGEVFVFAVVDQVSCQPSPASVPTVDDLANLCPTAAQINKINSDLSITFATDPSASSVCPSANSSATLTLLQERVYQTLIMMQQMPFNAPLAWTNLQLYDWFVSAVAGISFIPASSPAERIGGFCCSPARVINVVAHDPATSGFPENFLTGQALLFAHEARHSQGYLHTCGGGILDDTMSQLGAWAVEDYLADSMAFRAGSYFIPHAVVTLADGETGDLRLYRSNLWRSEVDLSSEFCSLEQGITIVPSRADLGSVPLGSSSGPQILAVTWPQGAAGQVGLVNISGVSASDFRIVEDLCTASFLPPSCSVQVTFQPSAVGARQAQLSINDALSGATVTAALTGTGAAASPAPPSIAPGGIVPLDGTSGTIQSTEWVSIYGTNLASSTVTWNGNFTTSLASTSVTINGKGAYLSYVSPTQINLQAPDDTTTGPVHVVVTTAVGTATSTVTLAQFAPSFLLLDSKHVAGIILRSDGSGAYGGGTYDIIGPTGSSLGYATVAAKAGDSVVLFGVGFGPTNSVVPAGQAFSGASPTTDPVNLLVSNVSVKPTFAGLSSAGLYQMNLTVPGGLGAGDVSLVATVGGVQTPPSVVISLK